MQKISKYITKVRKSKNKQIKKVKWKISNKKTYMSSNPFIPVNSLNIL